MTWVYDADPDGPLNPFSVRLMDSQGGWLPIVIDEVYEAYGSGQLGHYGSGLPQPGGSPITLFADGAPANAFGTILLGPQPLNTVVTVPPYSVQLYVHLGLAASVGFQYDANGRWTLTSPLPAGLQPGWFYGQVFALDAAQNRVLNSNGLAIRLVP